MNKLVILDINGCLAYKHDKKRKCEMNIPQLKEAGYEVIKRRLYSIIPRPGINTFVKSLQESYDVALYSSTTYNNLKDFIETTFEEDVKNGFKFIWTRNMTRLDPNYGDVDIKMYDTVKPLDYVLNSPNVNVKRKYNLANVLIIDNDERKLSVNPYENCMIWKEYIPADLETDESLLDSYIDLIDARFKVLDIIHQTYNPKSPGARRATRA